jgi:glyoxylase-like metal-dependent hydrolase (beta-lactamase superfamily II)
MKHFSQLVLQLAISVITIAQTPNNGSLAQPGYYRMQIGDFEITALSDGTIPQDVHQLLTHTQPGEIDRLLKAGYVTVPVETSVNAYVIKAGDHLILVDAGTADAYGPTLGKLTQSLLHAGYQPQQIDAVLITHIHPDHVGGLMDGDKMVFPNATIYISQPELDFWLTPGHADSAPAGLKGYFVSAEQKVGPYLKAGRVKTFGYGHELLPGITPIASPGHTPGHTCYELDSKGQKLVFWGDIMHVAAVQFTDPAVTIQYDIDPEAAAQQRKKAFSEAAKDGYWVAGDHLSFPGIGHLRADGARYVWVPVNYSTYGTGQ